MRESTQIQCQAANNEEIPPIPTFSWRSVIPESSLPAALTPIAADEAIKARRRAIRDLGRSLRSVSKVFVASEVSDAELAQAHLLLNKCPQSWKGQLGPLANGPRSMIRIKASGCMSRCLVRATPSSTRSHSIWRTELSALGLNLAKPSRDRRDTSTALIIRLGDRSLDTTCEQQSPMRSRLVGAVAEHRDRYTFGLLPARFGART